MFRDVLLVDALAAAGLPLDKILRDGPVWSRTLTAVEQSRADAILARFAGLPATLDDATTADLRDEAAVDALSDVLIKLVQEVVRGAPNRTPDQIREAVKAGRRAARRP